MEARLKPCLALPFEEEHFDDIINKAKDWALMHGAAMRSKAAFSMDSLNIAPFTLLPSTFPKKEFERAVTLQTVINELVHKVAHDHEFLKESLKNTIKVDKFTGRLYSLYDTVRKEGYGQRMSLGLIRADVMLEGNCVCGCAHRNQRSHCGLRQVEFNTIAAGFGWLGLVSTLIHSVSHWVCYGPTTFLNLSKTTLSNKWK